MSEFVFVINGVNLLDLSNLGIDFFILITQIAIAFFAGYVVVRGRDIYKKQKEEDRKEHLRQIKLNTLKNFNGYKCDLKGKDFIRALNEIPIVFDDSEPVINAWNNFHVISSQNLNNQELSNKILYSLFREMCKDLDVDKNEKYNYELFVKVFN